MKEKQKNIIILVIVGLLLAATIVFALTRQRDDFESTNQADLPSVYYFTADWCQPCITFKPTMEGVKNDYRGKINVILVDIDSSAGKTLALTYNVSRIPTLLFLDKSNNVLEKTEGALSRSTVDAIIKNLGWI